MNLLIGLTLLKVFDYHHPWSFQGEEGEISVYSIQMVGTIANELTKEKLKKKKKKIGVEWRKFQGAISSFQQQQTLHSLKQFEV